MLDRYVGEQLANKYLAEVVVADISEAVGNFVNDLVHLEAFHEFLLELALAECGFLIEGDLFVAVQKILHRVHFYEQPEPLVLPRVLSQGYQKVLEQQFCDVFDAELFEKPFDEKLVHISLVSLVNLVQDICNQLVDQNLVGCKHHPLLVLDGGQLDVQHRRLDD